MTDHEDWDTVTITAPVIDLLRSTPTRQHRAIRFHLVEQLPGRPLTAGHRTPHPEW
jgi:hypothetical protein